MEGFKILNITDIVKTCKFKEKVKKCTILELLHYIDNLSDFKVVVIF